MKKIFFYSAFATILWMASCKKEVDNTGNLTISATGNFSPNAFTATVNGQTSSILEYYLPSAPAVCGSQGCANFTLAAGTYNFTATDVDTTWQGSVTVTKGGCTLQTLSCDTGNVTFWVDSAANNIAVTMDGGTGHITSSFPTTTPYCGAQGCSYFTLHPGRYNYTATTASNISYSGSVVVGKDSCSFVKLF